MILIYDAKVNSLIHLYVVGVSCAFTLSQVGMVRHWLYLRTPGWQRSVAINSAGACTTALVAGVVVVTKFREGAWMIVAAIPILVLTFRGIRRHYRKLRRRLDCAAASALGAPIDNRVLVVLDDIGGTARRAVALLTPHHADRRPLPPPWLTLGSAPAGTCSRRRARRSTATEQTRWSSL